jgi:hypothetical protein
MEIPKVDLESTGAKEIFAHAVKKILENIRDVNTSASKPRILTLTFAFVPFPDRSGLQVTVKPDMKLGQLDTSGLTTTAFIAKGPDGEFHLYSRDLRQQVLFGEEEKPSDGKTAAANP